jgi:hypothetical protein
MPESTGALFHWAYDPRTATRRPEVDTGGSTLVIDIGYETTDCTLFEGMKYRRDRAFTIRRAGMGNVVRSVRDYLLATNAVRDVDESRLDLALRAVAGLRPGDEKWIEISGKEIEVTEVYDHSLSNEVQRITTRVKSLYTEDVTRALLAGGSVYHMRPVISSLLPFYVVVAPDPAHANVFGAYTALKVRDNRKG